MVPCPDTPPAPGGRVAVTCNVPVVLSSRFTSATACPSLESKPPFETFTTCRVLGSYETCTGTEYTFCAPFMVTLTANVDPTVGDTVGGSNESAGGPLGGCGCCCGAGLTGCCV